MKGGFFLDLVGSGSDDDYEIYARYYMNAAMRRFNQKQGMKLPRKQRPPFQRDRFLPKCGRPFDEGPPFDSQKWRAPKVEQYTR
jgi:hypothetical protein